MRIDRGLLDIFGYACWYTLWVGYLRCLCRGKSKSKKLNNHLSCALFFLSCSIFTVDARCGGRYQVSKVSLVRSHSVMRTPASLFVLSSAVSRICPSVMLCPR